jgi:ABC-type transport system substrate-binding protein
MRTVSRRRKHLYGTLLTLTASAALVLSACGGGGGGSDGGGPGAQPEGPKAPQAVTVTHTFEQEFDAYNGNTSENNASKNNIVLQRVLTGFWFFDKGGNVAPNPEFGSYEKTSDDPLTVEYSINPKAVWSDGNPIDCDDILLWWAGNSGKIGKGIFSASGTTGVELIEVPDCQAGDKDFTLKYSEPFADWESQGAPGAADLMPAHVVEKQGGLDEQQFIDAVKNKDAKALAKAAEFYSSGWVMEPGQLLDAALLPSSGPFKLSKWDAGQSITLVANDKYWGDPPAVKTVVIRFIAQDEQAQALQNNEVNIIEPQSNPDLLNQLESAQGIEVVTGTQYLYDHLDFNFSKNNPFSDKRLREAFAKCVPRKLIVDNLIKPQQADAKPMDVRNVAPFDPAYGTVTEGSGAENYAEVDIEGAKRLLAETGNEGMRVGIGYNTPNPRRTQVVELIADSCGKAGFKVVDEGAKNFFEDDGDLANARFDVALFGWAGSSLVSGWASTFTTPAACTPSAKGNNNGCYSNKEVDRLIKELNATIDPDQKASLTAEIEKLLWDDLATIPLYSQPALSAWTDTLKNIEPNPSQASITWNMDEWSAA